MSTPAKKFINFFFCESGDVYIVKSDELTHNTFLARQSDVSHTSGFEYQNLGDIVRKLTTILPVDKISEIINKPVVYNFTDLAAFYYVESFARCPTVQLSTGTCLVFNAKQTEMLKLFGF